MTDQELRRERALASAREELKRCDLFAEMNPHGGLEVSRMWARGQRDEATLLSRRILVNSRRTVELRAFIESVEEQ